MSGWASRAVVLCLVLAGGVGSEPPPAETNRPVSVTLRMADADLRDGRFAAALATFRAALDAEPGNVSAGRGLSLTLLQQGRAPESLQVLEALLARHPDDYIVMNNAAWLYATSTNRIDRRPARAVELAREALLRAPQDHHVWSTLAEAHYAQGDFTRAVRAAREAVNLAGRPTVAFPDLSLYRAQLERAIRAEQAFSLVD